MKIKERIEKTLAQETEKPDLKQLAEFYERMRQAGVILKKPYELPPLDTVGREFYQEVVIRSAQLT